MSLKENNNITKYYFIFISFITGLSVDLYLPSFQSIGSYFNVNQSNVQLTMSFYLLGFSIGQLVWGVVADKYGRLKILKLGLILYTFSSLLCIFSNSFFVFLALRFIQAIAACTVPVGVYGIARHVFQDKERATIYSSVSTAISFVPIFAPILGAFFESYFGWKSNFIFLSLFGVISFLPISYIFFKKIKYEDNNNSKEKIDILKNYTSILKNKIFLLNTLSLSLAFSCLFAFISSSNYIVTGLAGVSKQYFPFFTTFNAIFMIGGGFVNYALTKKQSPKKIIYKGSIIMLVSGILMLIFASSFKHSAYLFILSMSICTFGITFVTSNSIAEAVSPFKEKASSAAALFGFMRYVFAACISTIVAQFIQTSYAALGICIVLSSLIIFFNQKICEKYISNINEYT